jgi:hypothetical protein
MKSLKYLIIPFAILVLIGFCEKDDSIIWGTKELEWCDFLAKPDTNQIYSDARINTEVRIDYSLISYDSIEITICNLMNKNLSWVKIKDSIGIVHERLHFDISELYSRKLRKSIKNLKLNKISYGKVTKGLYNESMYLLKKQQELYDKEIKDSTGVNFKFQKIWCDKIKLELAKYEEFKSPSIVVKLN